MGCAVTVDNDGKVPTASNTDDITVFFHLDLSTVIFTGGNQGAVFLKTYGKKEGITLGEMQRCAMNVLRFAMESTAFDRI